MSFVEMLEFIIEYLNIDFDYEIVEDDYCYCDHENQIVGMNIDDCFANGEEFLQFVTEFYPKAREFNIILWSFLHELGHYQETEVDYNDLFLRSIVRIGADEPAMARSYFRLPREKEATIWAVNFISENFEKCKIVSDMLIDWMKGRLK